MRRPLLLTVLMWFCATYAIGAAIGIGIVAAGFGETSMGGMPVTRDEWLAVAAPVISSVGALMGVTSIALWRHRRWARWTWMLIWPLLTAWASVDAIGGVIPWWLARQAIVDAVLFGVASWWLLFRYSPAVVYFYRLRQARSSSFSR